MQDTPESGPVTLDDVAIRAGVSRWTVAAAVRGRGRINAETAQRLRALAAAMGYDPALTQAGRSLAEARHGRKPRHQVVAVSMPMDFIDLPYYAHLLRGAARGLIAGGSAAALTDFYRVMNSTLATEQRFGSAMLHGQVDAAIIYPVEIDAAKQLLVGWRHGKFSERPVVTVMRRLEDVPMATVDTASALIDALRYLMAQGHRSIACALWEDDAHVAPEQAAHCQRCLAEVGLQPGENSLHLPIRWMNPRIAPQDPAALRQVGDADSDDVRVLAWMRAHPQVTAIVAPNDASALQLLRLASRAGVRVPQDLSIVGSDGTDLFHDGGEGRFLATLQMPLEEVGHAAARMALSMVAGEKPNDEVFPAQFLVGRSIAQARR